MPLLLVAMHSLHKLTVTVCTPQDNGKHQPLYQLHDAGIVKDKGPKLCIALEQRLQEACVWRRVARSA